VSTYRDFMGNTLEPDTREETERRFSRLSEGSTEVAPVQDTFRGSWGSWGCGLDRFGIRWSSTAPLRRVCAVVAPLARTTEQTPIGQAKVWSAGSTARVQDQ